MKDYEQRERDLANIGHKDLIRLLLTFSPEQMAEFVAGAREIITQYAPKN